MKPFLKWAGGKTQLLPQLLARVPEKYGTYHEPFLGGGALFFALSPRKAILSDSNAELVSTYVAVRDRCEEVIQYTRRFAENHCRDPEHYYAVREAFNVASAAYIGNPLDAARFIYLNKTCFNGLWRVNRSGEFNVPAGRYKNPTICDEENLRVCSAALRGAGLHVCGFDRAPQPRAGDFWYADPPYAPINQTSDFTSYTKEGFGLQEQRRLALLARSLRTTGVHVLLSNSFVPEIVSLYDGFSVQEIEARRAINSKGSRRGAVSEALIS